MNKKTPCYRDSSDESTLNGQVMALLHFVAVGGLNFVILFICLIMFSALIDDIYDWGYPIIGIISFVLAARSYKKTLLRYSKENK